MQVWAEQWLGEHLPAQLRPLLAGDVGDMRSGVFVEEVVGAVVLRLDLNQTGQRTQLVVVQLCSDDVTA